MINKKIKNDIQISPFRSPASVPVLGYKAAAKCCKISWKWPPLSLKRRRDSPRGTCRMGPRPCRGTEGSLTKARKAQDSERALGRQRRGCRIPRAPLKQLAGGSYRGTSARRRAHYALCRMDPRRRDGHGAAPEVGERRAPRASRPAARSMSLDAAALRATKASLGAPVGGACRAGLSSAPGGPCAPEGVGDEAVGREGL